MVYTVQEFSWQNELQKSCFQNLWQAYAILISLYRQICLFVGSVLKYHLAFRVAGTSFSAQSSTFLRSDTRSITNVDVLLTVHPSIFISVINQLDAQNFVLQ